MFLKEKTLLYKHECQGVLGTDTKFLKIDDIVLCKKKNIYAYVIDSGYFVIDINSNICYFLIKN